MIIVSPTSGNTITYYSRYNMINKWEILDHDSRVVLSGNTTISGSSYKIQHSGITYTFAANNIYTYKSYFLNNNIYYLANQSLLQSYSSDARLDFHKEFVKPINTFKNKNTI